jgi:phage shock protein A
MGFFDRLSNLWNGILGRWISTKETNNPEAVYETAIDERIKRHRELKKAVSGIVYLRNKLTAELETQERDLQEVHAQLPVAIEAGDDEVALLLITKKNALETSLAQTRLDLEKVSTQAKDATETLISFQGEIEKLKRERDEMLAKRATAQARIQIQETLDGLSTDADIKALQNVRENIHKLQAEADVGTEIKQDSLDARLAKVKVKTQDAAAQLQLEELKKQMAARTTAAEGTVKKTM